MRETTPLCHITCDDGTVYTVLACLHGKLVETNERLLSTPQLVVDKVCWTYSQSQCLRTAKLDWVSFTTNGYRLNLVHSHSLDLHLCLKLMISGGLEFKG